MKRPPENDAAPLAGGASVRSLYVDLDCIDLTPPAHHKAPQGTSGVAARRIAGHAARQRSAVLAVIRDAGSFGATDADIESATGFRAQSVSPRRGELRRLGLIVDSGRRRLTPRGRPAAVWVATSHAARTEGGAA